MEQGLETAQDVNETSAQELSTQMQDSFWGNNPTVQPQQSEAQKDAAVVEPPPTPEPPKVEETILDEGAFVKQHFGFEDLATAKKEFETWKEKANQQPEIKFENEFNEKLFKAIKEGKTKEVRQYLETQERLEHLTTTEVNKDNAEDVIKMGMQLKYKDLSPPEINYKYNKEFGIPAEPKQGEAETDEEFADRKSAWAEKVSDIEMNKVIEAKLLRPELETSKSKISLPEIKQEQAAAPKPTQEDLDNFKRQQDVFVNEATTTVNKFTEFSVNVKNKDVDYNVSYTPSKEEKSVVDGILKEFAEDGFNPNAVFSQRWVNENGTLNVDTMAKDLLRIYAGDNMDAKIANDAADKRLEIYLKDKKNINVNEVRGGNGNFQPDTKTESEKLQEQFWGR